MMCYRTPLHVERVGYGCFMHGRYNAGMAELVDAPDLGSGAERRGGSTPSTRTIILRRA